MGCLPALIKNVPDGETDEYIKVAGRLQKGDCVMVHCGAFAFHKRSTSWHIADAVEGAAWEREGKVTAATLQSIQNPQDDLFLDDDGNISKLDRASDVEEGKLSKKCVPTKGLKVPLLAGS